MPHRRHSLAPGFHLLLLTLSCVSLLASCNPWSKSNYPEFTQTFVDVNRRGDDDAATVVFDPVLRILAVGRESGKLELWDATKKESRIALQAHTVRTEYIAFGREDGIVLTNSVFDGSGIEASKGPRIWDARTGELVHALNGMWAPGPIAASPVRSLYLIGDSSELRLYDHTRRSFVGSSLKMEQDGQVTAIASDRTSGLIAVGTSRGELMLMTLNTSGEVPRLHVLRQTASSPEQARSDIHALVLLDDGKRLISAAATENGVFEWDSATLERRRRIPTTLNTVRWASYTAGAPWLVLAGTESTRGRIELVDLNNGVAWRYRANTTAPRAVLLPEIRLGAAAHPCAAFLNQEYRKLHSSESVNLCKAFAGKPMLIINTASHCGFTPQFKGLEAIHEKYKNRGLAVVGFASDDFNQEAKDEAEAADTCFVNYGVTFTMLAPQHVKGPEANAVFKELARQTQEPKWNFNKYLVTADGKVTQYFDSRVAPDSQQFNEAIEKLLK